MDWKEYEDRGDVKPARSGPAQAIGLLAAAELQLDGARKASDVGLLAVARDEAYGAMPKAAFALVLTHGYRLTGSFKHSVAVQVTKELLGPEH